LRQTDRAGVTFLYIGRLSPEKGVATLGEAFGLASALRQDIQLQVIGAGPEGVRLKQMALAAGWNQRLQMTGSLSRDEARMALWQADVFVLPSRFESMSYTLLEAMACGRPVIATDVGGNRDLVEPGINGLLVPSANPVALSEAILQIADSPALRDEYGRAGRQKSERYTLASMIIAIRTLYRELDA
jgi:glycosyltransferase involved in cell wall biosynthesis